MTRPLASSECWYSPRNSPATGPSLPVAPLRATVRPHPPPVNPTQRGPPTTRHRPTADLGRRSAPEGRFPSANRQGGRQDGGRDDAPPAHATGGTGGPGG